ncbi:MAG TPA: hypothetical protein VFR37_17870 [Longimicrobium sp.]|nr:hypothetical protein [Longimicrobium sp.]
MRPIDTRPGTSPPPGTDAFPPAAPHAVPAYSPTRWLATLSRWWGYARDAYAARTGMWGSGRNHFFPRAVQPAVVVPAEAAAPRGVTVRKG